MEEAQVKPTVVSSTDSNSNLIAAAAWLLSPLSSIVLIVLDNYKKDKYVQFHAWESLAYGVLMIIGSTFLGWTCIIPLGLLLGWIIGIVKAYQGEKWMLPVIGEWAQKQADSASSK